MGSEGGKAAERDGARGRARYRGARLGDGKQGPAGKRGWEARSERREQARGEGAPEGGEIQTQRRRAGTEGSDGEIKGKATRRAEGEA